jgi:hypothetical protein
MFLTLVHSTRLLPWVVKIMSVPRSVSRATVAPYARHQLKARWNRLKGREIAGPAIDGRCTKKQRLAADASGHGASPDTKRHESGLLRVTSDSRLERLVVARASTRGHLGHMGRLGRNGGRDGLKGAEACACQSMIWQRGLSADC